MDIPDLHWYRDACQILDRFHYFNIEYHVFETSWDLRLRNPHWQYDSATHSFSCYHDDVIKWKKFPRYWPFVRGIPRSPVNSPHKDQWRRALMLSLICSWRKGWVNNRDAGDLRSYRAHYDVTVMCKTIVIYIPTLCRKHVCAAAIQCLSIDWISSHSIGISLVRNIAVLVTEGLNVVLCLSTEGKHRVYQSTLK